LDYSPPTETDGPPGALAICRAGLAMGKAVTLVTDEVNAEVVKAACFEPIFQSPRFVFQTYRAKADWDENEHSRLNQLAKEVDCVIAIERPGPAADGRYYTMSGKEMPASVIAPLERLVEQCNSLGKVSIGIGDGGNEVGMGKIREEIIASPIPNAALICCKTATTHLLVCGVSTGVVMHLQQAFTFMHVAVGWEMSGVCCHLKPQKLQY